ncbi:dnaJ homolog subfamily C member 30, mitochondrial-like [Diorhabda carinulata]|uniref:dnaJ homolog subfamily C member 30, mitochondrial-like n=1 Tax=Diorhabda carinulata TaxID=1163345 RepID=UPI0025A06480|nr:dnaJ homolog subfamily C member 30, mitochondrial-like [Diorhabda carinulata]
MSFTISLLNKITNRCRLKFTKAYSTKPNHYNSLGISPKSTQNEIKTAYYKLSMIYHPDKNKDEASLQKFRNITEAYEVLGNVTTRKMYDKGLHFGSSPVSDYNSFYKPREGPRNKPPPPDGRTPIYDFDEWSKSHYGATFHRQMENRRRRHEYQHFRQKTLNDQKLERVVFFLMAMILICTVYVNRKNYDQVVMRKQSTD